MIDSGTHILSASQAPGLPSLPIVAVPGTLCDARVFTPFEQAWRGRDVLHADITSFDTTAAAAEAIVAGAPDRFILVGFSLGGIVGLEIAARAPGRVAAMILIGTNGRDVPAESHAARRAAVKDIDPAVLVGTALWPNYVHPDHQTDSSLRDLVMAMARECPAGTAERQTGIALSRVDSRTRLRTMTMPVLILSGADDVVAPPSLQYELADGLANARLVLIPSAGHFAVIEQPDAAAAAMAAWLEDIDPLLIQQSERRFRD